MSGDLTSPVLAVELMHSPDELTGIVGPPGDNRRVAMMRLTWIDLLFIPAYVVLFVLVGLLLIRQRLPWVGVTVIGLGLIGGVLDVLEDLDIIAVLQGVSITPRHWSLPKWSILFITIGMVVPVYRTFGEPSLRRVIGYLAAICSLLTAVLGLCGVVLKTDPLIESGGKFMGIGLVFGFLFFATHNSLKMGLRAALDRLAQLPFFDLLAKWPTDEVTDETDTVSLVSGR